LFDSRLSDLRAATMARAETEARLAGLGMTHATEGDLPQIAAGLAALNYQRWADVRRAELNQTLARQTATWMDTRDAARLAFGKTQALSGVAAKLAATNRKSP
jgi:hypothetical protein